MPQLAHRFMPDQLHHFSKENSPKPLSHFELMRRLGVDTEKVDPAFWMRLELLDRQTKTVDDEQEAIGYAEKIFFYLEEVESPLRLSSEEQQQIKLATLFTDIGKTGPLHATPQEQETITAMYALEFPIEREKAKTITIAEFLDMAVDPSTKGGPYINQATRDRMADVFAHMNLQSKDDEVLYQNTLQMPMRPFWNLHARWTFDLLNFSNLPQEVTAMAANHHMLEGVNPMVDMAHKKRVFDPHRETINFGSIDRPLDRREIFVILLDKYQARMRRGNLNESNNVTHEQAISWLKLFLDYCVLFQGGKLPTIKAQFMDCIDVLDHALKTEEDQVPETVAA